MEHRKVDGKEVQGPSLAPRMELFAGMVASGRIKIEDYILPWPGDRHAQSTAGFDRTMLTKDDPS